MARPSQLIDYLCRIVKADEARNIPLKACTYLFETSNIENIDHSYLTIDYQIAAAASKWNIRIVSKNRMKGTGAKLFPVEGGFILKTRNNLRTTTRRFFQVHEIAHILFYNVDSNIPFRKFSPSRIEELICDKISRQTLIPEIILGDLLNKIIYSFPRIDIGCLNRLSEIYKVIPWQIVKRILDRFDYPQYAAMYWRSIEEGNAFQVIDVHSPYGIYLPLREKSLRKEDTHRCIWQIDEEAPFFNMDKVELANIKKSLAVAAFYVSNPWSSIIEIMQLDNELQQKASRWRAERSAHYPFHSR